MGSTYIPPALFGKPEVGKRRKRHFIWGFKRFQYSRLHWCQELVLFPFTFEFLFVMVSLVAHTYQIYILYTGLVYLLATKDKTDYVDQQGFNYVLNRTFVEMPQNILLVFLLKDLVLCVLRGFPKGQLRKCNNLSFAYWFTLICNLSVCFTCINLNGIQIPNDGPKELAYKMAFSVLSLIVITTINAGFVASLIDEDFEYFHGEYARGASVEITHFMNASPESSRKRLDQISENENKSGKFRITKVLAQIGKKKHLTMEQTMKKTLKRTSEGSARYASLSSAATLQMKNSNLTYSGVQPASQGLESGTGFEYQETFKQPVFEEIDEEEEESSDVLELSSDDEAGPIQLLENGYRKQQSLLKRLQTTLSGSQVRKSQVSQQ